MKKDSKILFWDIETTNLSANFGFIVCVGFKRLGEATKVVSIADYPKSFAKKHYNDFFVVQEAKKIIEASEVICTHYGSRFDLPFLNARLIKHGLTPVPPDIPHIDTWRISRYKLQLNSNRLATIAEYFNLGTKSPVTSDAWLGAMSGDQKSIDYVVKHCKLDVDILERVYMKLRPLITNHPNLGLNKNLLDACPNCGKGGFLQKHGFHVTHKGRYQRYHCMNCGATHKKGKAILRAL